jgi:hypothetical protein
MVTLVAGLLNAFPSMVLIVGTIGIHSKGRDLTRTGVGIVFSVHPRTFRIGISVNLLGNSRFGKEITGFVLLFPMLCLKSNQKLGQRFHEC